MDFMLSARELLFEKKGEIPEDRRAMIESIMSTGLAFNPMDHLEETRDTLGLPAVPADAEDLKQIHDLMEQSGTLKSFRSQRGGERKK
ncbi:MAG TPA: hypothetical protein VEG31_04585 [Thermoproteota archaeon]|nr:hypothetical protein [Thermoproteota archaeon]